MQMPKPNDVDSSLWPDNDIQFTEHRRNDITRLCENLVGREFERTQLSVESTKNSSLETGVQQEISDLSVEDESGKTTIESTQEIKPDVSKMDMPAKIGDVLNNRYRLEARLGQGGMGSVFKALDLTKQAVHAKNHYVAIKVLLPILAKDSVLVTGFHREAEKAQKLTHANIIKVFDSSRDGDRHYIVMEYLQGEPLNRSIKENGAISFKRAWPIIRGMGRGLAHAHEENIIHSDFKPGNVFVVESTEEVKILDFGIASELKKAGEIEETIFDPRLLGGLNTLYASFEMLNGAATADRRDDVFAFGLVVYELLTGKHPYNRKPASEIYLEQKRGIYQPPTQPAGLSKMQWHLLSQAIAIEQEQRPDNLQEWLKAFDPAHDNNKSLNKRLIPALFLMAVVVAGGFFRLQSHREAGEISAAKVSNGSRTSAESVIEKLPKRPVEVAINAITPPSGLRLKTSQSRYHIGQYLQLSIQPHENGYLALVHFSSAGKEVQQIFPNVYQKNDQVKANRTYQIPPGKKPKMLEIRGPEGTDVLIAVFSKKPLPKLESYFTGDGNLTGLQQDVIIEKVQYQIIK